MRRNENHTSKTHSRSTKTYTKRRSRSHIIPFFRGIVCTMLILLICFSAGNFFSSAHDTDLENPPAVRKYYKSIQIERGDSIWSIAETHVDQRYNTVKEYADELIILNNLDKEDPDCIFEGDYLTVAYYD